MQTKTTFYDILEVSANAGQQAIRVSFERLKADFLADRLDGKGMDAAAYFQLIKEAYATLSDSTQREAYDQKIFGRQSAGAAAVAAQDEMPRSGIPSLVKWVLVLILIVWGGVYYKNARDAERAIQVEQARQETQRLAAQKAAEERLLEMERTRQQREDMRREEQEVAMRQQEFEQARREADRVSERLEHAREQNERAEERKQREAERLQQREDQRRQREAEEVRRRIEREKAMARQLEQDNYASPGRVAIISRPQNHLSGTGTRDSDR